MARGHPPPANLRRGERGRSIVQPDFGPLNEVNTVGRFGPWQWQRRTRTPWLACETVVVSSGMMFSIGRGRCSQESAILPAMHRRVKMSETRRFWSWATLIVWIVALGYGVSVLFPVPTQGPSGWLPQSFILVPILSVGGIIVLAVMGHTFLKRYALLVAGIGVLSPTMYFAIFEPYPSHNFVGLSFAACSFFPGIVLIIAGILPSRQKKDPRTWEGHCRKCGYDLRGLRERKCPECAEPF